MSIFSYFLDYFFPKQSANDDIHNYLTDEEISQTKPFFKVLNKEQQEFLISVYSCAKYDKKIKNLLHRAKAFGETAIAKDFAKVYIYNLKGDPFDLFVFVPTDPKRFKKRNYHISEIICNQISKKTNIPYLDIFQKTKPTKEQAKLNREERLKNLDGVFELDKEVLNQVQDDNSWQNYKNICIIDDISTTGTTISECAKLIKKEYPDLNIYGMCLASN